MSNFGYDLIGIFMGMRAVHACWHEADVDRVREQSENALLTPDLLVEATTSGTALYAAIEVLLKGYEVCLPDGITFPDKEGNPRDAVRISWWHRQATQLAEVVLPTGTDISHAGVLPIPPDAPSYDGEAIPCFVGHYWMTGEHDVLAHNVTCRFIYRLHNALLRM